MERFPENRDKRRAVDKLKSAKGREIFDPLTGLATREWFHERAQEQWERCARAHRPLALLFTGIDRFDAYREQQGDAAAERSLQSVAAVLAGFCRRRADFAGRLRDHEFGILLSETGSEDAMRMAAEIRGKIAVLPLGDSPGGLTVSVGVAAVRPTDSRFVETLMIAADQALKEAYGKGGDRVAEWLGY